MDGQCGGYLVLLTGLVIHHLEVFHVRVGARQILLRCDRGFLVLHPKKEGHTPVDPFRGEGTVELTLTVTLTVTLTLKVRIRPSRIASF